MSTPGRRDEDTPSKPTSTPRLDQTKDDTDEGWGDWRETEDRDRWLEEQRPPHWE